MILDAKSTAHLISTETGVVPACPNLGAGGDSEGIIIFSKEKTIYIPKSSGDLIAILDAISDLGKTIKAGIAPANAGGPITTPELTTGLEKLELTIAKIKAELK